MALIVQKFGGSSVGSPQRICAVADRIAAVRSQGHALAVVVSAMGDTTDELIELARQVSDHPPHREMDMLLSTGERISMALLSMALADRQVPAISLTGSQTGIITDGAHRRARIQRILGDRVRAALSQDQVVIVAGFQGVSETKEITTLGRGGSDTTAVALAAALDASACEIFTDVDGVYSADPRVVPQARFWKTLPHDLMVELATRGAGVLHPRSVELAKKFSVPLAVKNSLRPHLEMQQGTLITSVGKQEQNAMKNSAPSRTQQAGGMEEYQVVGVTADKTKFLLSVEFCRPSGVLAFWEKAASGHWAVLAPQFMDRFLLCFVERESEAEWQMTLSKLQTEGFVEHFQLLTDRIPLSIVGDRFSQDGSALAGILDVLGKKGIEAASGVASSLAITVAIREDQAQEGVRCLHAEFLEKGSSS